MPMEEAQNEKEDINFLYLTCLVLTMASYANTQTSVVGSQHRR